MFNPSPRTNGPEPAPGDKEQPPVGTPTEEAEEATHVHHWIREAHRRVRPEPLARPGEEERAEGRRPRRADADRAQLLRRSPRPRHLLRPHRPQGHQEYGDRPMNTSTPRPPTAHTHRGTPRPFTIAGHRAPPKPAHTPTHR